MCRRRHERRRSPKPNYIRKTKKYVLWNAINCFLTQNFTKIGQSAAELWPKIFNDMKHRAVSLWRVNRLRFHVTSSVYVCKHYFSNHVLFVKVILSVIVKFSAKSLRPIHLTSPKADVCRSICYIDHAPCWQLVGSSLLSGQSRRPSHQRAMSTHSPDR